MISEPEMSDESGGDLPGDLLSNSDDRAMDAAAVRQPRPWLWALGGIAATSAVWATVIHGTGGTAPDLHGYHLGSNPCSSGTLNPLKDVMGAQDFTTSDATVSTGPALDKLACILSASTPAGKGWVTGYTVSVSVELHKKTDPRTEFENTGHTRVSAISGTAQGSNGMAVVATGFTSAADVHPVSDIGDEAYLVRPGASGQTLEVLHGGAVLTLEVSGYPQWNGPAESSANPGNPPEGPDLTRLRPALTTAMRHLMASLASS